MEFIDLKAQQNQEIDYQLTLKQDIQNRISQILNHGKYILGPEVKQLEELLVIM